MLTAKTRKKAAAFYDWRDRIAPALLGAGILVLLATPSEARITGNDLLQLCKSDKAEQSAVCHGFFRGLTDMHGIFKAMKRGIYCVPVGVTLEQAEKVALKWLDENRDETHRPAAILVTQALLTSFPCAKEGEAPEGESAPGGEAAPSSP